MQIVEGGILVECLAQDYVNNNDQTDGFDLENIQGVIFLYGVPGQKDMIDNQRVCAVAVRAGVYRFKSAIGGVERTVAAYKFVKKASSQ